MRKVIAFVDGNNFVRTIKEIYDEEFKGFI